MKICPNKTKLFHQLSQGGIGPLFDSLVGEMGQLAKEIMMSRYNSGTIMSYSIKLQLASVKALLELIEWYFNEQSLRVIRAHKLDTESPFKGEKSFTEELEQLGEDFLENLRADYIIYSREGYI